MNILSGQLKESSFGTLQTLLQLVGWGFHYQGSIWEIDVHNYHSSNIVSKDDPDWLEAKSTIMTMMGLNL